MKLDEDGPVDSVIAIDAGIDTPRSAPVFVPVVSGAVLCVTGSRSSGSDVWQIKHLCSGPGRCFGP